VSPNHRLNRPPPDTFDAGLLDHGHGLRQRLDAGEVFGWYDKRQGGLPNRLVELTRVIAGEGRLSCARPEGLTNREPSMSGHGCHPYLRSEDIPDPSAKGVVRTDFKSP